MNETKQITKPTTKIIAGAYKGKVLSLPSLDVTRSSKAVLKESDLMFYNLILLIKSL